MKAPLTQARARAVLLQAREDLAIVLAKHYETQEELYRLLSITGELYEGILNEQPPAYQVRAQFEEVAS